MIEAELSDSDVPVVLVIYNRADTTSQVFAAIRRSRPRRLYVFGDAPREKPGDAERVAAARAATDLVDWPCRVERRYAEANQGAGRAMAAACAAVFDGDEQAVFLEDDCVPQPGFFRFCAELLERYRHDERVGMISGSNPVEEWDIERASYHFGHFETGWGWATWRRAWRTYDFEMRGWDSPETASLIRGALGDDEQARHCLAMAKAVRMGRFDAWDVQFSHANLKAGRLAITPARNMVANIGFGPGASNTVRRTLLDAVRRSYPAELPLRHPPAVAADRALDRMIHELRRGRLSPEGRVRIGERLLSSGRALAALSIVRMGREPAGDRALAELEKRVIEAIRGAQAPRS